MSKYKVYTNLIESDYPVVLTVEADGYAWDNRNDGAPIHFFRDNETVLSVAEDSIAAIQKLPDIRKVTEPENMADMARKVVKKINKDVSARHGLKPIL